MTCKCIFTFFLLHLLLSVKAQQKWSLQACIEYALKNNISVKQADLQTRFSALSVSQNRASQLPSLSFNSNAGSRFGLSENPTTGIFQGNNFFSTGASLTAGVTLFNWFAKRQLLHASILIAASDKMAVQKAENDLTLNINAAYLQVLFSKELVNIALLQVSQTGAQLEVIKKKITVGLLSAFDASQIQLQAVTDSAALLQAQVAKEKAFLQLKALLNLDLALPMDIENLPAVTSVTESLLEKPEKLYATAATKLPEIKQVDYQLEAAQRTIKAAKAARYPTFSLYGSAGSNFVNIPSAQTFTYVPQQPTGATVVVNGVSYDVVSPAYKINGYGVTPFFNQFHKNFGQNVGIALSIPLLNGRSLNNNLKREELNLLQLNLQKEKLQKEVKSLIYTAYLEAVAALSKVRLNERLVSEAGRLLEASQKRYALNLLSTQDLLITKNTVEKYKIDLLSANYDLLFKIKVLEFFKTQ